MAVTNSLQTQSKKSPPFSVAIRQDKWQDLIQNTLGDKDRAGRFVACPMPRKRDDKSNRPKHHIQERTRPRQQFC